MSLISWRAAIETLSLVSSLSMMAVFLVLSTSRRSSEWPVRMVRTFQLANRRAGVFFVFLLRLSGAEFPSACHV